MKLLFSTKPINSSGFKGRLPEDLPLKSSSGFILSVEFVSSVYSVNGDKVIQCNIRDISERKKLEAEILKYQLSVNISMREMVETLATVVVARDSYTGEHMKRVANLCTVIATQLNLPVHTVEGVNMAALIHDIGKISIPAEILTKHSELVDFELQMLQNHVQTGYDMLKHIHFPWNIAQAVLHHHERIDGSGYPNAIKGDIICLEGRIIAVADTVEAMSSDRPYRKGKGIERALEEIAMGRDKLYDSDVVTACLKIFKDENYRFPDYS